MKIHKPWQPGKILITSGDVAASIEYADHMGWHFAPSPINAAFVVMLALNKVKNENSSNN